MCVCVCVFGALSKDRGDEVPSRFFFSLSLSLMMRWRWKGTDWDYRSGGGRSGDLGFLWERGNTGTRAASASGQRAERGWDFFFWLAPLCPRGKGTEMKVPCTCTSGGGGDKDANFGAATPRAHTGQSGADDAGLWRGCEALVSYFSYWGP